MEEIQDGNPHQIRAYVLTVLLMGNPLNLAIRFLALSQWRLFVRNFGTKYQLEEKKETERRITSRKPVPAATNPQSHRLAIRRSYSDL